MNIRASSISELEPIKALLLDAFGDEEYEQLAPLVSDLLTEPRCLSFVALDAGNIIGHIVFSPVSLDQSDDFSGFILSPLAVSPAHQGQGIGSRLIKHGLFELKKQSADAVFVLGDPRYYSRSGFQTSQNLQAPYPLAYPQAWQVLELNKGVLEGLAGSIECVPALMAAELW